MTHALNMFDDLMKFSTYGSVGYPPYNIKKLGENKYVIELAVAGLSKSELSIELSDNQLTISGKSNSEQNAAYEFLHKGIASRSFVKKFDLAKNLTVKTSEYENGMLRIFLEQMINVQKILIGEPKNSMEPEKASSAEFLTE